MSVLCAVQARVNSGQHMSHMSQSQLQRKQVRTSLKMFPAFGVETIEKNLHEGPRPKNPGIQIVLINEREKQRFFIKKQRTARRTGSAEYVKLGPQLGNRVP